MDTIYLDQFSAVMPKADGVEEAMAHAADMDAESIKNMTDGVRGQLNKLFHGPGGESVVFTSGVGAALDGVIRALFKEGDHVLISSMEGDDVMNALNEIGHEADNGVSGGVEYTRMPSNEKGQLVLFDPLKGEKGFDAIEKLLRPNTKAIIVNHASEVCGSVLQAKEMGEFAKRHQLLMIVNTAQTAGYIPIFMNIWGIDVLTFSGGYGLFASEKIGGFIASDRAKALLGGDDMRKNFEQEPLDVAAIAGLERAFEFISEKRLFTLSSTGQKRAEQFIRKVQHINGVHIIGPGYTDRVPVVSIQTDFMDESELCETLKKEYGIVMCAGLHHAEETHKTLGTYPRGTARFSFNYFNTEEDIEKVTQALWQLTVRSEKADTRRMPKE
jgi:selenocysteine lyase/cysteine desulfurase